MSAFRTLPSLAADNRKMRRRAFWREVRSAAFIVYAAIGIILGAAWPLWVSCILLFR